MPWNALNLSQDTKDKLNKFRSRKQDENRQSRLLNICRVAVIGFGLMFLFTFNKAVLVPANGNAMLILELMTKRKIVEVLLIISIIFAILTVEQAKKLKKAKDKVQALRSEIVDRLTTSWVKTNHSDLRDTITRMVKDETDEDIYYSS